MELSHWPYFGINIHQGLETLSRCRCELWVVWTKFQPVFSRPAASSLSGGPTLLRCGCCCLEIPANLSPRTREIMGVCSQEASRQKRGACFKVQMEVCVSCLKAGSKSRLGSSATLKSTLEFEGGWYNSAPDMENSGCSGRVPFWPPPSLPAPFHLRILHKYSLGVFLPLSGPIPALPALTVVHESEGCRLSSVYGALEEADGLAYPSPSLPCPLPCSSPSPFLPLRIPHLCQEGKPTCSYFFWCLSFSLLYPDSISFPSQSIKIFEPFLYAWLSGVTQKRNKAWSLLSRSSRMEDVDTRKMSWDRS